MTEHVHESCPHCLRAKNEADSLKAEVEKLTRRVDRLVDEVRKLDSRTIGSVMIG